MKEVDERKEILMQRVKTFAELNLPVHITFKRLLKKGTNLWERGYITDPGNEDYFKIEYLKEGKHRHNCLGEFVFYLEILDIEQFQTPIITPGDEYETKI